MWPHRFGCILPTVVHGGGPSSQCKINSPIFCPEYVRFVIKFTEYWVEKCPLLKQIKLGRRISELLLQNKVWKRLCAVSSSTCFDGTNMHFCRETGYVANTRFFGLVWTPIWLTDSDISDLTSGMPALPALWQHRLPCGHVVVEHEMCGYCGPISLKSEDTLVPSTWDRRCH